MEVRNVPETTSFLLSTEAFYSVPEETARVARAIYPEGNIYMNLYDTFSTLFEDEDFIELFSHEG